MRLSEQHQREIARLVRENISDKAEVWLFGSRCDDDARGGDIDLYIETPAVDNLFKRKIELRLQLEDSLGDQKIDLVIRTMDEALAPIHILAKQKGCMLKPAR